MHAIINLDDGAPRRVYYSWLDNREVINWRMQQSETIGVPVKSGVVTGKGRNSTERIFHYSIEQYNPRKTGG